MKKFTFFIAALLCSAFIYAQKPEVTSIGIAGRAVKGFNEFNSLEMFTKVAEGEFIWIGYMYHHQFPETTDKSMGFKLLVNSTNTNNTWANDGVYSMRAKTADEEVSHGGTYEVDYSIQKESQDYKWRLIANGDGYYKITINASDVNNVTMKVDHADQSFADLISLSVDGAQLNPAFSPEVISYTCTLLKGTQSVKPTATAFSVNTISGDGTVDVSSGSGVSEVVVTSIDGNTTKKYTITYTVSEEGEEDCTHLIVNNNFDYVAEGVAFGDTDNYPLFSDGESSNTNGTWRPLLSNKTKIDNHLEFYGWQLSDWEFLFKKEDGSFINADETAPNQSIGINSGTSTTVGSSAWIAGNLQCIMPENFEFFQTIAKDKLTAGTYKVSCLMGIYSSHMTSQRLFANNNVQFYGKEADYEENKTEDEIYNYAGYIPTDNADIHKEMTVYITLTGEEDLKIGIRSGNKTGAGETGAGKGNMRGWFKMDNFRLLKLDAADVTNANVTNITLSAGTLNFVAATTTYDVELPVGTTSVTPAVTTELPGLKIQGAEAVDVSEGSGVSTITVYAPDGTTTQVYTINYTVEEEGEGLDEISAEVAYFVNDGKLTLLGVDTYVVYDIKGLKIAEVKANDSNTSVALNQGLYIVKAQNAKAFKVVVK